MNAELNQTEQANLRVTYICQFHTSARSVIKTLLNARPGHLLRIFVMHLLLICCRAQLPHNFLPDNNKVSHYNFNDIRYSADTEYLYRNSRFTELTRSLVPSRRKQDPASMSNSQVSPTSLISRFQYAPSPNEASGPLYRTRDNAYQPPQNSIPGHQAVNSNRFQNFENAWSQYGNGSGALNQQASLSQTLLRRSNLTELPEPRLFSELTDQVLLEAYRSKSPCLAAKVDWVRDSHNCSVFFVCSRGRVAAVMTCPSGENWSNRVTNCVPFRSRWDDCIRPSQAPHSRDEAVTQSARPTLRPRRVGRRWRRLRTTTSPPLQTEATDEQQESNSENDHRYYTRSHAGYGKYYETGGRRLKLITKNRRGGYHVESIHDAAKTQDTPNFNRFPRRKQRFGVKAKRRGRMHHRFHRFDRDFLPTKNEDRRDNYPHDIDQLGDHTSTSTPSSVELSSSQAPIAASGSGTRPKIRFVITHSQRRRSRLKLNGTKIKSAKGADLDFLHNIKKINELEYGGIGEYPVRDHSKSAKESTTVPSTEESTERDNQWWSDKEETATAPTTTSTTTIKTTPATTTPVTTRTTDRETTSSSTHSFLPECGVSATSMIVGGLPAQQGRWPWVVSLQLTWNQNHVCGATLIHPQWIVTAAHCVNGPDLSKANEWRALFWQKGTSKQVDVIVQHPGFVNGDNYPNDIALLRLREPVDVSGFDLRHACMPKREEWRKKWEKCWIMGWGESKDEVTSELKELEVKVRKNSECSARWGWKRILNSHVCAGDGGRGACNGDSGGPLICRQNGYHYLAGITSWGVGGCQTAGYPSVFTRVAFYYNWIEGVIKAFSK